MVKSRKLIITGNILSFKYILLSKSMKRNTPMHGKSKIPIARILVAYPQAKPNNRYPTGLFFSKANWLVINAMRKADRKGISFVLKKEWAYILGVKASNIKPRQAIYWSLNNLSASR